MGKIKYFLRIYIRNMFTYKRFSFINIFGLSAGLTVSLLILLYVRYETSFENFNPNAKNIYRVVTENFQDGEIGASTPLALSDVLKSDYPEIDKVIGLMTTDGDLKTGDKRFTNISGAIVEKDFFEMFNIPLQSGNTAALFQDPYEAVVTTEMADQLFGKTDPMGKTIEFEGFTFTVTGIIAPIPTNSVFRFDYFLSDGFRYRYYTDLSERWYNFGLHTFITFKGIQNPEGFENRLSEIEERYYPDFMKNRHRFLIKEFRKSHLDTSVKGGLVSAVSVEYLWLLSMIAVGILLIACLNFMNISIAGAAKRNIETGIKKINGASVKTLIKEFFFENSLIVFISVLISIYGISLLLPSFNNIIDKEISISFSDPFLWLGISVFGFLTALLSGLYPSIVLSRHTPVKIMLFGKGGGQNKLQFQKSFIVLQYIITITLGIALLFIFKQISFMQKHNTGFNRKDMFAITVESLGRNGNERMGYANLLVQSIEKSQAQYGYGKASLTEFVPGFGFRNNFKIYPGGDTYPDGLEVLSCDVDENFADVFGLHILKGRFFSKDYSNDENALIINESALKKLGWDSIEGKNLDLIYKENKKEVVGVINDINIESLKYPSGPMIFQFGRHHNYPGYVVLRIPPEKVDESIRFIRKQWELLFPGIPFSYESIEEKFNASYGEEKKLAKITSIFSLIAILLSLSGIFALSALESEKRIKEIGIRKINGAKVMEVMSLLNAEIIKWILVAFLIAVPVSYYSIDNWLTNYAYRTSLDWWIFILAGAVVMIIALLTVSLQSWRAATRNPVEALKYE
ncbi:MAG TPA: ABC transporter permease [Bacteroidales bacterium]|nr:ABC transporter permease [Bacteroidales bacterium]